MPPLYTPRRLQCQECARFNLSDMSPVCTPGGSPLLQQGEAGLQSCGKNLNLKLNRRATNSAFDRADCDKSSRPA